MKRSITSWKSSALGVRAGDIVCFEPRYREAGGFLKGRFMDNKAGCFVLFEVAKRLAAAGLRVPVELFFSNYEEVGHGGAGGYAETLRELLVIDMGVIGHGLSGHEQACSICAKDSSGPVRLRVPPDPHRARPTPPHPVRRRRLPLL